MSNQAPTPIRLLILISGRGSNMQAIVQTIQSGKVSADICAVISNRADAQGLVWAHAQGIPTQSLSHRDFESREAFDRALMQRIDALAPDYILLAGFMRVLSPAFVAHFDGRIVNIHPSLLPAFPGLHTHEQALAVGVQWHGCTVHFVTPVLDHGPIIAQGTIPVLAHDTPDTLAERLLPVEHHVYAEVVRWLSERRVSLDTQGRVQVQGVDRRAFT